MVFYVLSGAVSCAVLESMGCQRLRCFGLENVIVTLWGRWGGRFGTETRGRECLVQCLIQCTTQLITEQLNITMKTIFIQSVSSLFITWVSSFLIYLHI